jgi:hypothetical protein
MTHKKFCSLSELSERPVLSLSDEPPHNETVNTFAQFLHLSFPSSSSCLPLLLFFSPLPIFLLFLLYFSSFLFFFILLLPVFLQTSYPHSEKRQLLCSVCNIAHISSQELVKKSRLLKGFLWANMYVGLIRFSQLVNLQAVFPLPLPLSFKSLL